MARLLVYAVSLGITSDLPGTILKKLLKGIMCVDFLFFCIIIVDMSTKG